MKYYVLCFSFLCLLQFQISSEPIDSEDISPFPQLLTNIFYNFGQNLYNSVTYNYGLNFVGAGFGTWVLIETEVDWNWRNITYHNAWVANMGLPLLAAGYVIPPITPIALYAISHFTENAKLQTTAAALTQALLLTLLVQVPLKVITGRTPPGVISDVFFEPQTRNDRTDNFSGEFNWFNMEWNDGWPSGHVANTFSAAAVIAEMYNDKPLLKAGVYTYAVLMGFSVASNVHWASESFAGALIGYAIGKTVGKSFRQLHMGNRKTDTVSLYCGPSTVGITIRL